MLDAFRARARAVRENPPRGLDLSAPCRVEQTDRTVTEVAVVWLNLAGLCRKEWAAHEPIRAARETDASTALISLGHGAVAGRARHVALRSRERMPRTCSRSRARSPRRCLHTPSPTPQDDRRGSRRAVVSLVLRAQARRRRQLPSSSHTFAFSHRRTSHQEPRIASHRFPVAESTTRCCSETH